jgi:hypothetical protein
VSVGRPTTLPSPWREYVEHCGGVGEFCALHEIGPSTLRRWAHGVMPGPHTRRQIAVWAKRVGPRAPWAFVLCLLVAACGGAPGTLDPGSGLPAPDAGGTSQWRITGNDASIMVIAAHDRAKGE